MYFLKMKKRKKLEETNWMQQGLKKSLEKGNFKQNLLMNLNRTKIGKRDAHSEML